MNRVFYRQQLTSYLKKQTSQGPLWWFWMIALPVVPQLAYLFLGYVKILPETDGMPRPVYIIIGITLWLMFYDSVSAPSRSVEGTKPYFLRREINLPTLLSAWLPERLVASAFQLTACIAIVAYMVGVDPLGVVAFLATYFIGAAVLMSFGYLIAVAGLISPSALNLIDVANRFLLFLSGVIFPLPASGVTGVIQLANPYYVFIEHARRLLVGLEPDWLPVIAWTTGGVLTWLFLKLQLLKIEPDVRDFLQ